MNPEDLDIIKTKFDKKVIESGQTVQSVGWRSKQQQYVRFDTLFQIGDLNHCSVLDVGCGFGDFLKFLDGKQIVLKRYTGIDISQEMIKQAVKLHGKRKETVFKVCDFPCPDIPANFDYVMASGIFNCRVKDNLSYLKSYLPKMLETAQKGVAFNLISKYVDYEDKALFYFQPEAVFAFCQTLTRRVVLRHDYMPYEFTVYLYKDQGVNSENCFTQQAGS